MADDRIRARYDAFFEADFLPLIRHDQTQGAEERTAYANEYAAFQLGQINLKLGRLIDLMERNGAAQPAPALAPGVDEMLAARPGIAAEAVVAFEGPRPDQPQEDRHGQGSSAQQQGKEEAKG